MKYVKRNSAAKARFRIPVLLAMISLVCMAACSCNHRKGSVSPGISSRAAEKAEQRKKEDREQAKRLKTQSAIHSIKTDDTLYFGESFARLIEDVDLGESIEKAKGYARTSLAEKIRVKVRATINVELTGTKKETDRSYEEEIEEKIRKNIETYTNIVLSGHELDTYLDYPEVGLVTCIVYISKDKYDQDVRKALKSKKQIVMQYVDDAISSTVEGNMKMAMDRYLDALHTMDDVLGGMPVRGDIDHDGNPEDYRTHIESELKQIIGNFEMAVSGNGSYVYDASGHVRSEPLLYVNYTSGTGKRSVNNLPLKAEFMSGGGSVSSDLTTGSYGELQFKVDRVDPSVSRAEMKVTIDETRLPGLERLHIPTMPFCLLEFNKALTIALTVSFDNIGGNGNIDNIAASVRTRLIARDMQVVDLYAQENGDLQKLLTEAKNKHADFLFRILAVAEKIGPIGDLGMVNATCRVNLEIFNLASGAVIAQRQTTPKTGYGMGDNYSAAGWEAFGKSEAQITKLADDLIGQLHR